MSPVLKGKMDIKPLVQKILQWNANRLDLFEVSIPDANGSFNGVMRFFYQDECDRYQTKCIRVCSEWTTLKVVDILHDKFSLSRNFTHKSLAIYEYHPNSDHPRRLADDECPLLVQLNWSKEDRDGKFVLKIESPSTTGQLANGGNTAVPSNRRPTVNKSNSKRRWSLWAKTPTFTNHRNPLGCAAVLHTVKNKPTLKVRQPAPKGLGCLSLGHHVISGQHHSPALNRPLLDAALPTTKVNASAALSSSQRQHSESKPYPISQHPKPNIGGTVKIYGGNVCPEVSYRTLVLSGFDTTWDVLRQSLEKYDLTTSVDPAEFCLIMRVRTTSEVADGLPGAEHVLADSDHPLEQFVNWSTENRTVTFELQRRANFKRCPSDIMSRSGGETSSSANASSRNSRYSTELDSVFACLIEVDSAGSYTGAVYPLPVHKGQVCIGTATMADIAHQYIVTLPASLWPHVEPHHLIIWRPPVPPGVTASMAAAEATKRRGGWLACRPCASASLPAGQTTFVYVNNRLLTQTPDNQACVYWLSPGDLLRLGNSTRSLKIWPGDGSSVTSRQMIKSTPSVGSTSSTQGTPATVSTEVSRHPFLFDATRSIVPVPPFQFDPSLNPPITTAAISYFSPFLFSSANSSVHLPSGTQRLGHRAPSPPRHPAKSNHRESPDSLTTSSSSLSASPLPESASPELSRDQFRPTAANAFAMKADCHVPTRSINKTSKLSISTPENSPIPSETQRVPVFKPLPYSPELYLRGSTTHQHNESKTSSVQSNAPEHPGSANSSQASDPVRSPCQQSSKSRTSSTTTISDRLPCQLAFAPNAVKQLLEWLIPQSLQCDEPQRLASCPLGPSISIYLMLRAIYRQCDRWEMIETRQLAKNQGHSDSPSLATINASELAAHQRQRRQRELLGLALGAVEQLQYFEAILIPKTSSVDRGVMDDAGFHQLLHSSAAWLANASQLLHLLTRDVNFAQTFELKDDSHPSSLGDEATAHSAWGLLQDQLTDVVQIAFSLLTGICCTRLDKVALPSLLSHLALLAEPEGDGVSSACDDFLSDERFQQVFGNKPDPVLNMLTDTIRSMHASYVNPAFVVQLFARILHRLNAQLFNFILGPESTAASHISPAWGRALYRWIRTGLCAWAVTEGLSVAAECYLQRASQASELMMADMSSVESLYNVAVDLVGLNSRQVHALLSGYRSSAPPGKCDSPGHQSIPETWIDFVVSGVKLVADRLLAEEESTQGLDSADHPDTNWTPRLKEPLDLLLPLLLPEDSYLTDNPIPISGGEESVSCDSGVWSRPTSEKEPVGITASSVEPSDPNCDPLITVESLRLFLDPAIRAGWCRLSVRPIQDNASSRTNQFLSWSVYLAPPPTTSNCSSPVIGDPVQTEEQLCSQPTSTQTAASTSSDGIEAPHQIDAVSHLESFCSQHQPYTVTVPKLDRSLGLSIVAAKSEDGHDLGIYVRAVVPDGGASHARLLDSNRLSSFNDQPVLQPGDRLLSVNGQSVLGLSQESAAALVTASDKEVSLTVVRNPSANFVLSGLDSLHLSPGSADEMIDCPECRLQKIFQGITPSYQTTPVSSSSAIKQSESLPTKPPPPAPSASGPVLHIQKSRSSLDTAGEFNSCSPSTSHPNSSRLSHPTSTYKPIVSVSDQERPWNRLHSVDSTAGTYSIRGTYSPVPSFLTDTTSFNPSVDCVPSEYSLNSCRTESFPTQHTATSVLPCHRPKGQSASFDDWLTSSRLKEICDDLTSALSFQTDQDASMVSPIRSNFLNRVTNVTGLESFPDDLPRDPSDDTKICSPQSANSRALRTRVPLSEPDVSFSPSNSSWLKETTASTSVPVPETRTSVYPPSSWSSRSVGDLPLLEGCSSSQPVRRYTRTLGRVVQRRHTSMTTSRFNLGPRPEPPNHVPCNTFQSS